MMLQFERVVATGTAALDSGIGDTALKTFNGGTYIYSVTGKGGGIVSWHLQDDAGPQVADLKFFDVSIEQNVDPLGVPVSLAGADRLILDVGTATGLVGYDLNSDGTIGGIRETGTLATGGGVSSVVQYSTGALDLVALSHESAGQITAYQVQADGSLSEVNALSGRADSMHSLRKGSSEFVIAADSISSDVSAYLVDPGTGSLSKVSDNPSIQILGINTPAAIEVVQAYGQSWVIVAGSGSSSLSVMKLTSSGQLVPTDHAVDTLHTRFGAVQDLAVIDVNGHVFVLAGGGDDGLSLFTLTQDGQLIHRDSFADTLASGLQNVQSLSVAHIGDEIQVFAASQADPGLTQLSVDVSGLGIEAEGSGTVTGTAMNDMLSGGLFDSTLIGGAGDDILITGTSATTMTGGSGMDIFVVRQGSGLTTVIDFQAGIDQLDLTNFEFLRSPAQLTFSSTAQGAQIQYRGADIILNASTGSPLTSTEVFGASFNGADHIPVGLNSGPDNNAAPGFVGAVSIDSSTTNTGLRGAEIRFTPNGGNTVSFQANDQGEFDLNLPTGTYPGQLEIIKSYSTASNEITALDALQVLRMAVGLDPIWGPAAPENWIAADITRDGSVTALDALSVLQVAVGLPSTHKAEWVFVDSGTDLSGINQNNIHYDTKVPVTVVDGDMTADMTSILLGNLEAV